MELFKSYSKANAVKVIALAINLEHDIETTSIKKLIDKLKENQKIKDDFNEEQIQTVVSMTFNQDGIPNQKNSIGGIVFNKKEDNKILWSLIVNTDSVVVTCRNYNRWCGVSELALKYIDVVLKEINNIKIAQLTLEYLDEFEILQIQSDWKKQLFKENCEYITPHIYQLDAFWHISHGYFINLSDVDEKMLDTIDINYFADEADNLKHKVNMRMQHKLLYNSSIVYNKENIFDFLNKIHIHSKDIFFKLVSDKVTEKFNAGEIS